MGFRALAPSHVSSHSRLHAFMLRNIGLFQSVVAYSSVLHEPMVGDTHLKCVGFISAAGIPYVCSVYCVAGCLIGVIFGGTSVLERKAFAGTSK